MTKILKAIGATIVAAMIMTSMINIDAEASKATTYVVADPGGVGH